MCEVNESGSSGSGQPRGSWCGAGGGCDDDDDDEKRWLDEKGGRLGVGGEYSDSSSFPGPTLSNWGGMWPTARSTLAGRKYMVAAGYDVGQEVIMVVRNNDEVSR